MKSLLAASVTVCGVMLWWVPFASAQIRIEVGGFPGVSVRVGPGVGVRVGGIGVSVGGGFDDYPNYSNPCAYGGPYYGYSGGYYTSYGGGLATTGPNADAGTYVRATIVNPANNGVPLGFQVNGQPYALAAGTQQDVMAGPGVEVVFDRGAQFGIARYSLGGGRYSFAPTPTGWDLQQTAEAVPAPPGR
jgi:hypothetical protein